MVHWNGLYRPKHDPMNFNKRTSNDSIFCKRDSEYVS